jgi:hypothetical protein
MHPVTPSARHRGQIVSDYVHRQPSPFWSPAENPSVNSTGFHTINIQTRLDGNRNASAKPGAIGRGCGNC